MTAYQKVFLAYVRSLKAARIADNAAARNSAKRNSVIYKKWLEKHSRA